MWCYKPYKSISLKGDGLGYTEDGRTWRANFEGFPINWFSKPSKTVTFVEENINLFRSGSLWYSDPVFINDDLMAAWRNNFGTVAYLDGHVSKLRSGRNGVPYLTCYEARDSKGS